LYDAKKMSECEYKEKCLKCGMYGIKCTNEVECGLKKMFEKYKKVEKKC
jgi:hypothetical protein